VRRATLRRYGCVRSDHFDNRRQKWSLSFLPRSLWSAFCQRRRCCVQWCNNSRAKCDLDLPPGHYMLPAGASGQLTCDVRGKWSPEGVSCEQVRSCWSLLPNYIFRVDLICLYVKAVFTFLAQCYIEFSQLETPIINGPAFVIANLTLSLTCSANGIDSTSIPTTFTWFKDKLTLDQYTGPQLSKTALTSASGLYACSVTYLGATSTVSQHLTVTVCEYESVDDYKSGAYILRNSLKC
jgi:hypothetical protein